MFAVILVLYSAFKLIHLGLADLSRRLSPGRRSGGGAVAVAA
jgi:hypothetical protein